MAEYNHAWVLTGQLKPDEAIPILKRIIAKDSTFHRAYHGLVRAYAQKKALDKAADFFRLLIDKDASNAFAHYGLAEALEAEGNHEAAIQAFLECIGREPRAAVCYPSGHWYRAMAASAATRFERAIPREPNDPYRFLGLSDLFASQGRKEDALANAKEGLAKSQGQPELEAAFHVRLAANCEWNLDGECLGHLQEAYGIMEGLGDWEGALDAASVLTRFDYARGAFDEAQAFLQRNLSFARNIENRLAEEACLRQMGELYRYRGDLDAAIESYSQRERLDAEIGYTEGADDAQYRIQQIYREQGRLKEALDLLDDLLPRAAGRDRRYEALLLTDKGAVLADQGEYFKAIEAEKQSIAAFQSLGLDWPAGAGLGMLAMHYTSLGDYGMAIDYYEKSLESARHFNDPSEVSRNLYNLGDMYLRMGRPREALKALEDARTLLNSNPWFVAKTLLNLGRAYLRMGRPSEALQRLNEALRQAQALGHKRYEAEALCALGETDLHLQKLDEAERFFQDSLDIAEKSGIASMIVAARQGLGETALRLGKYAEARREFETAIESLESVRNEVPDPELRIGLVQQHAQLYEEMIESLYALHLRDGAKAYDRLAFDYAERGRARSFLESLWESRAHVNKGLSPEQSHQREHLLAAISMASKTLQTAQNEPNRQALKNAEMRLSAWVEDIRAANPEYQKLQYPQPYSWRKVQSEIVKSDIAILEYALGEKRSFLWAFTGQRLRMIPLPGRGVIETQVNAYRRAIARAPRGQATLKADQALAGKLYETLLRPADTFLRPGTRVLIIPDGILYYLPFEALLCGTTDRYVVEDFAIAYAPSASAYGSLVNTTSRQVRRELLAFGDPPFGKNAVQASGDVVRGVYERNGWRLSPLPNTRREVEAIAALYPASQQKIYLGPAATEAAVKREDLMNYKRIHFATHAVVDDRTPARSGVVLSLIDTGQEDGVLRMPEIFNLELNADLVVLSACQTGLGQLIRGEGMVGLTRAFLYAGSQRVVVSLWEVNDVATADFMKSFYANMRNASPAAALRAAKLAMIHSSSPAYRHPYFWAPFILTGQH